MFDPLLLRPKLSIDLFGITALGVTKLDHRKFYLQPCRCHIQQHDCFRFALHSEATRLGPLCKTHKYGDKERV